MLAQSKGVIMLAIRGRIIQTPTMEKPYKVILEQQGGEETEHPVSTIREGEALIRSESPPVPARDTLRDQSLLDA
jgi:hypothetical protein